MSLLLHIISVGLTSTHRYLFTSSVFSMHCKKGTFLTCLAAAIFCLASQQTEETFSNPQLELVTVSKGVEHNAHSQVSSLSVPIQTGSFDAPALNLSRCYLSALSKRCEAGRFALQSHEPETEHTPVEEESVIHSYCQLPWDLTRCQHILRDTSIHVERYLTLPHSIIGSLENCQKIIGLVVEMKHTGISDTCYDSHKFRKTHDFQYQGLERLVPTLSSYTKLISVSPNDGFHSLEACIDTTSKCFFERSRHEPQSEKSIHSRKICEESVCQIKDLGKKCQVDSGLSRKTREACKMCYPRKDMKLVNTHCDVKRKQEMKAFYIAGVLLVAVTASASVAVYVRNRRRGRRNRAKLNSGDGFENANLTGSFRQAPGPQTEGLQDSPALEGQENVWDDFDMMKTSTAERQWRHLGIFARGPRKRIQDLFDLESLRSRGEARNLPVDRVPVMPRAANASIRGSVPQPSLRGSFQHLGGSAGMTMSRSGTAVARSAPPELRMSVNSNSIL